jgi:hypothetical protein
MSLQKILDIMSKYKSEYEFTTMHVRQEDEKMRKKMKEMLCELSADKWLKFCENEPELVFNYTQSHTIDTLYADDGWFKLYKCILEKHPKYITHIFKHHLTQEQNDELLEIGKKYIEDYENRKQQERQNIMDEFCSAITTL